ncbi:phage holin family protein [Halalkalibacterium halodurans]|uniref:phage holin family protein n=1 Tax=Halalkalibacterium halodurans TaxID=86665 RepID=UPI002E1F7B07|nr:phage holin family protein [Halalkalibacterium halodurans]MED4084943.1 phage holin family protein [Halalkalibacterium halodurans]MED4104910.1 phage holin family protein [Halalkalibacterium halodurans]MED4110429.1 phage holin family protein [Halalkalibacterium halodurans]MED4123039.1 phage holin family protein [Halalkalibacterium halodurans]
METMLKWAAAALAAAVSFLYGEWTMLLSILLTLVVFDYVTGLVAAGMEGEIQSRVGLIGIARKIFIFVMVAVAHLVDKVLIEVGFEVESLIFMAAIVFYIVNELISIFENAGRIGLPVPKQLKQAITILKGDD